MKTSDSDRHLAVPSMKRLGSLRKRPFFHSKFFKTFLFKVILSKNYFELFFYVKEKSKVEICNSLPIIDTKLSWIIHQKIYEVYSSLHSSYYIFTNFLWKVEIRYIYTRVKYITKSLLTLISEFFLVKSCYIYKNNLLYFIAAVL